MHRVAVREPTMAVALWIRSVWLVLALVWCPLPGRAATLTQTASFNFNHAGAVDSGPISVLGTFTTTSTAAAAPMLLPKFDPSLGTLTGVDVVVATTGANFAVAPSGVLSLVSSASVTRTLALSVVAGTTTGSASNAVTTSGGTLLTLLGLGSAEIGGAPLNKTVSFTSAADLAAFTGTGVVAAGLQSTDVLTASTLLSLSNGAGFRGSGTYAGTVKVVYTYQATTPVAGRVFTDDGRGAGTANDGILNGGEPGVAGRTVRLLDAGGTLLDSTVTATDGRYRLLVPPTVANGSALRVQVVDLAPALATGASLGNTGGSFTRATSTSAWTFASGAGYAGLDFGAVPLPSLGGPSRQTALPGTVVFYRHRFVAPSGGQVIFSVTHLPPTPVAGWSETVHVDTNANGVLEPTELPAMAPVSVVAGQVIPLIVRVFVPAAAPFNTRVTGVVQASMAYTNAVPAVSGEATVLEITDVTATRLGDLVLLKTASTEAAAPGTTVVYTLSFTNGGAAPLSDIVVSDATPVYTSFVSATLGSVPASLGTPVTNVPAFGANGPLTWAFPGQLAPGASGGVSFTVRVNP